MKKKDKELEKAPTHHLTSPTDKEEPIEDLDEALEVVPFTYAITAYGADYPVDSLVKRITANDIVVPRFSWDDQASAIVGFQREYVWPRTKSLFENARNPNKNADLGVQI